MISEVRKFDLQRAFARSRALPEDFEDQAGAIDHLSLERALQIALLHRRERAIQDGESDLFVLDLARDLFDLAPAEIGCRPDCAEMHFEGTSDIEIDGAGQPDRLFQARFGATRCRIGLAATREIRPDHDGARRACSCNSALATFGLLGAFQGNLFPDFPLED